MKKRNDYFQILKLLACVLISNSHCPYPATSLSIGGASSIFQIGGGWGNTIFFVISGFLVAGSNDDFIQWIKKRYIRIIPITIIMSLFWYAIGTRELPILYFVFTCFWFVTAIVMYYPAVYIFDKMKKGHFWGFLLWISGYVVLYLSLYEKKFFVEGAGFAWFKIYAFFGVILLGAAVKKYKEKLENISYILLIFGILASGLIWAAEYGAMIFWGKGYELQFIITVSRMLFAFCILLFAIKVDSDKPIKLKKNSLINLIADSTLEVYLIQVSTLIWVEKIREPINVFVFWAIAIVGGTILHNLYKLFVSRVITRGR